MAARAPVQRAVPSLACTGRLPVPQEVREEAREPGKGQLLVATFGGGVSTKTKSDTPGAQQVASVAGSRSFGQPQLCYAKSIRYLAVHHGFGAIAL